MSDTILLAIISSTTTVLTVVITGIINARANRKQNEAIVQKVDTYHKDVNGRMGELLITTKALGNSEGQAQEKEKQENKK